jgi:hypothetical protein
LGHVFLGRASLGENKSCPFPTHRVLELQTGELVESVVFVVFLASYLAVWPSVYRQARELHKRCFVDILVDGF